MTERLEWNAPGPGRWALDRSHINQPATLICQRMHRTDVSRGTREMFEHIGAPLDALEFRFVNGLAYSRIRPLIAPDKPAAKLPPLPLLKLAVRLHPAMRKRRKTAERMPVERPWRAVVDEWHRPGGRRDQVTARNLQLQDVDRASLSDEQAVAHARATIAHAHEMMHLHFWLHGFDLGPIGFLLHSADSWGVERSELVPLLEGASPSTSEAERVLLGIKKLIDASGRQPRDLEEARAISGDVAAAIDAFLRVRGTMIFSRYDIDGLCLSEAPDVLFASIMSARDESGKAAEVTERIGRLTQQVRERIPAHLRADFDEKLTEARAAMDLRDDNGPHTLEWPNGLMRLALLDVGRRLAARGLVHDASHALELDEPEITVELFAGQGPSADELARRAHWRATADVSDAPRVLGTPEPPPPLHVLPAAMAHIAGGMQAILAEAGLDGEVRTTGLTGIGVGNGVHRGRVCRADSPEDAIANLQDGDVLVVPCTTPAYNMVLAMAGAVITAEGGVLSHAAVLARELGIPAVIGAPQAMNELRDGMIVDVDATAGEIRVVANS
jgi:pyruvate,water dikinase